MTDVSASVLQAIGNTPLVELRRVVPPGCARILVKVEGQNPTGSMKDRMALSMIGRAEADGRLRAGGAVVEYTGGSTGASLALVCAATGYRLHIVSSDAFSEDKLAQMAALGAELTVIPSDGGLITAELIGRMIDTARHISRRSGAYWTDQLNNTDSIAGYYPMGKEIWNQSGGKADAFVQSVGTTASLRGVATVLRRFSPGVRIIAVEPGESAVLSGGPPGAHRIEGIGIGYAPPMWDPGLVDEIVPVPTADAEAMARRLAREEGLFAGTSSGANVIGAIRVGERLGLDATVVTLLVDSGLKYISTEVYRREGPGQDSSERLVLHSRRRRSVLGRDLDPLRRARARRWRSMTGSWSRRHSSAGTTYVRATSWCSATRRWIPARGQRTQILSSVSSRSAGRPSIPAATQCTLTAAR